MWTIPNILTVLRLLAAPAVALVFALLPRPLADWTALVLFAAASATDWLDGYLARSWNQQSRFGTMLDPIADKAMVVIALAVVMGNSGMAPLVIVPAAAVLLREVFVSGLREFLGPVAGRLAVTRLAKWKTAAQMVAIAVLMAGQGAGSTAITGAGTALLWVAAGLTVVTGWDYFTKALPFLKEEPR